VENEGGSRWHLLEHTRRYGGENWRSSLNVV
jgi:hypothetical protein